jgi:hypothetical protein
MEDDLINENTLQERLTMWVKDYCDSNSLSFERDAASAIETFGSGLTEDNFVFRFTDCCNFLHQ